MTLKLSYRFWAVIALLIVAGLAARRLSLTGPFELIFVVPALIWAYERSDDFRAAVNASTLPGRNGALSLFIGATFSIFAVTFGIAIVLAIFNLFTALPSDVVTPRASVPPPGVPTLPMIFHPQPWFDSPGVEQMFRLSATFLFLAVPLIWHLWLRPRDNDIGPAPRWPLLIGPAAGILMVLAASTMFDTITALAADAAAGRRNSTGLSWLDRAKSFTIYAWAVAPFFVLWVFAMIAKGGDHYDNARAFRWSIGIYLGANLLALIAALLVLIVAQPSPSGSFDIVSGTGLALVFGLAAILMLIGPFLRIAPKSLKQSTIAWLLIFLGTLPLLMLTSAFTTPQNGFEPVVRLFAIVTFPMAILFLWWMTGLCKRWFLQVE
jgi:hypothetical protein